MLSLADPRVSNPVLSILQVKPTDEIIAIEETAPADGNFVLTHLLRQIFYEENDVCLVCLHETADHYRAISKKLGIDLDGEVRKGRASIIDILSTVNEAPWLISDENDELLSTLIAQIKGKVQEPKRTYLIIDDLSHLLDLGVQLSGVIEFTNWCLNLDMKLAINVHVCDSIDRILLNTLRYSADLSVNVAPLKTGHSNDVTGFIHVQRGSEKRSYHFKTYDRGIRTFQLGEAIHHLRK